MHKIDFNNYKKKQRLKRGIAVNQNSNVIQKILAMSKWTNKMETMLGGFCVFSG